MEVNITAPKLLDADYYFALAEDPVSTFLTNQGAAVDACEVFKDSSSTSLYLYTSTFVFLMTCTIWPMKTEDRPSLN